MHPSDQTGFGPAPPVISHADTSGQVNGSSSRQTLALVGNLAGPGKQA